MKKLFKNEIGITLVALVVTVIILLILAGISIASLTENGLFEKAKLAKEKQENSQIEEEKTLADYKNKIDEHIDGSQRAESVKKTKLWEFNPEATDANNGERTGTIILTDLIDNYDAISVTGQMKDAKGKYCSSQSMLILKENYYINSDYITNNFIINSRNDRCIEFGLRNNTELNKTEIVIGGVNSERLLNVYGINF